MAHPPYRLSYPELGNYDVPIRHFVMHALDLEYVTPPPMTKRTIDLGAKYSPDYACAPFKCMLGCYIECMEKGANVIIQTGGTCRLGYYGELHQQILRDLGYDFKMFNITLANFKNILGLYMGMKELAPDAKIAKIAAALPATLQMIVDIDRVEDYMRQNMGFERHDGDFESVHRKYLALLRKADTLQDVKRLYEAAMKAMKRIPVNKPEHPLRVGIVGEYFTIMDPCSNHEVEKKLAKMGTEVHRWMNLSNSVLLGPDQDKLPKLKSYLTFNIKKFPSSIWYKPMLKNLGKYAAYDTGASSIATISLAKQYAEEGFDGLVHVKSFGCMPEMDAIPILHNISADYKIPTLFLSYDTQTSDAGIETRLEAFYDMVQMKHQKNRLA